MQPKWMFRLFFFLLGCQIILVESTLLIFPNHNQILSHGCNEAVFSVFKATPSCFSCFTLKPFHWQNHWGFYYEAATESVLYSSLRLGRLLLFAIAFVHNVILTFLGLCQRLSLKYYRGRMVKEDRLISSMLCTFHKVWLQLPSARHRMGVPILCKRTIILLTCCIRSAFEAKVKLLISYCAVLSWQNKAIVKFVVKCKRLETTALKPLPIISLYILNSFC